MNYFIIENNQQVGPLTLEQLVARNITSDTLVWKEGMEDWQPAWKVDELHTVLDQIRAMPSRLLNPSRTAKLLHQSIKLKVTMVIKLKVVIQTLRIQSVIC